MTTTTAPAALFPTFTMDQIARIYADSIHASLALPSGTLAEVRHANRAIRARNEAARRGFIVFCSSWDGSGIFEATPAKIARDRVALVARRRPVAA
jgi:hypothetical protein